MNAVSVLAWQLHCWQFYNTFPIKVKIFVHFRDVQNINIMCYMICIISLSYAISIKGRSRGQAITTVVYNIIYIQLLIKLKHT